MSRDQGCPSEAPRVSVIPTSYDPIKNLNLPTDIDRKTSCLHLTSHALTVAVVLRGTVCSPAGCKACAERPNRGRTLLSPSGGELAKNVLVLDDREHANVPDMTDSV